MGRIKNHFEILFDAILLDPGESRIRRICSNIEYIEEKKLSLISNINCTMKHHSTQTKGSEIYKKDEPLLVVGVYLIKIILVAGFSVLVVFVTMSCLWNMTHLSCYSFGVLR